MNSEKIKGIITKVRNINQPNTGSYDDNFVDEIDFILSKGDPSIQDVINLRDFNQKDSSRWDRNVYFELNEFIKDNQ